MLFLASGSSAQALSTAAEGLTAMDLPTGPKATALGGAFSAWADDTSAVYWNPAGMAFFPKVQIQTAFNQWFQDTFFQDFGGVFPTSWGALGLRVSYISLGSITGRDDFGYTTGTTYSPEDWGWTLGTAVKFGNLAVGVAAKTYLEVLPDDGYASLGLDAGALWRSGVVSLSFGARNMGLASNYTFPTEVYGGAGVGWDMGAVAVHLATDTTFTTQGTELHHGLELGYQKTVFLRTGYEWFLNPVTDQDQTGLSVGAGLTLSDVELDYSFVSYGDLGSTNQVALSYQFDLPKPSARAKQTIVEDDEYGAPSVTRPSVPALAVKANPAGSIPLAVTERMDVRSLYQNGLNAYKTKAYDTALAYFFRALKVKNSDSDKPFLAQTNVMIAVIYEYHEDEADHLTQAILYYQRSLVVDPNNPVVRKHLGELSAANP